MLIALGVTGGIGAYKAVEVARGLQKRGHDVVAIMTRSARRFVGEVTFEAITRRPVITDQFARGANANIEHIALATDIGLLLVAPATAEHHRQVRQRHRRRFPDVALPGDARAGAARAGDEHQHARAPGRAAEPADAGGARRAFVDPGDGFLACGWIGKGRLAEPEAIVEAAERRLAARRARCSAAASSSRPARPTKTSIRCATSATDRAAAWATRLPPKPRAAARTSSS